MEERYKGVGSLKDVESLQRRESLKRERVDLLESTMVHGLLEESGSCGCVRDARSQQLPKKGKVESEKRKVESGGWRSMTGDRCNS